MDRLSILCTDIAMNNNETIRISVIYRSHFLKKPEFVDTIKNYLNNNINIKNHMLIGDFNIDTMHRDLHMKITLARNFLIIFQKKRIYHVS